jgi:hypothetical protein
MVVIILMVQEMLSLAVTSLQTTILPLITGNQQEVTLYGEVEDEEEDASSDDNQENDNGENEDLVEGDQINEGSTGNES